MIPARLPPPAPRKFPVWDVFAALCVLAVIAVAAMNVVANMRLAGAAPGFGFLFQSAGFDVSETLIPYGPDDAYMQIVIVGVLNTLLLATVSLILSTLVGLLVGLMAVGPSPVGRAAAQAYVELFRNLPKILILLVLFVVSVNGLPHVREAIGFGGFYLSNRSAYFPSLVMTPGVWAVIAAFGLGVVLTFVARRILTEKREREGQALALIWIALPLLVGLPALVALLFGVQFNWSVPELKGFDYKGGVRISVQFLVIAVTLALYHGAQIGEVIRGGIEAVPAGQSEAAAALGLNRAKTLRLIILPQVVRIIIPSMNNQYVNLIKNTSVAIAVGYSDLMSVTGTIINQTFRPLEMMILTMAIYLVICLSVTTLLNRLNDRLRVVER